MRVSGCDPGHPAEEAQGAKDVAGKPEVDEHKSECPVEVPQAWHFPDRLKRAADPCHLARRVMKSRVECDSDQRRWPHAVPWVHEEPTTDTSQSVANDVSRQSNQHLVT